MIFQSAIGAIQKTLEYFGLGYIADYVSGEAVQAIHKTLTTQPRPLTMNIDTRPLELTASVRPLTLMAPEE